MRGKRGDVTHCRLLKITIFWPCILCISRTKLNLKSCQMTGEMASIYHLFSAFYLFYIAVCMALILPTSSDWFQFHNITSVE